MLSSNLPYKMKYIVLFSFLSFLPPPFSNLIYTFIAMYSCIDLLYLLVFEYLLALVHASHCCYIVSSFFSLSASHFQSSPVSILVQLMHFQGPLSSFLWISYSFHILYMYTLCINYTYLPPFNSLYTFFLYFISLNNLGSNYCNLCVSWCEMLYWSIGSLPFGMLSSKITLKYLHLQESGFLNCKYFSVHL